VAEDRGGVILVSFIFALFLLLGIAVTIIGFVGWSQGIYISYTTISVSPWEPGAGTGRFELGLLVLLGPLIIIGDLVALGGTVVAEMRERARWRRNLRLYEESRPHINDRYCVYCDYPIRISGSRFCPNCGASLITIRGDTDITGIRNKVATKVRPISVVKTLATCPVCKSDIRIGDPVVSCPHCGILAHRDHLLEYLHVNGNCPSCGKHLNEKEVKEHLARAKTRIASKKRVSSQDSYSN
jgi:predicted RNA-binding Zn-ribbon protein involved in translation (DUF1610 family)